MYLHLYLCLRRKIPKEKTYVRKVVSNSSYKHNNVNGGDMFVTCYNEKVTYIISKSRTFLDNPSVIPSTQRKNMKIYMN